MNISFHEFPTGMTVMEGGRCIAVARPTVSHGWILRHHDGSWTDPKARTQGLIPGKYPYLLNLRTRPQTRALMSALARWPRP